MLNAVEQTAMLTHYMIESIINQMESTLQFAKGKIKWYTKEVNELIYSQPYIKPKLIGDFLQINSRTTLTKYFKELVEAHVLTAVKDGKEVYYVNNQLVKIIERT
jgi:Fic family protein